MGTASTVLTLHGGGGGGGLASLELRQRGGGVGIKLVFVLCHVKMSKLHKFWPYSVRKNVLDTRVIFREVHFYEIVKSVFVFQVPSKTVFFNQTTKQVNYYVFCNE